MKKTTILIISILLALLVALVGWTVYSDIQSGGVEAWGSIFARSCKAEAVKHELRWSWRPETGCYLIDTDGVWRPLSHYTGVTP